MKTVLPFMSMTSVLSGLLLRLRPDPRPADDRPPFFDLTLLERRQSLGRLLVAGGDIEPEIGEALLQRRIAERFNGRSVKLADQILWRALRRPEAEPAGHIEPR